MPLQLTSTAFDGFDEGAPRHFHGDVLAERLAGTPRVTGLDVLKNGLRKRLDVLHGDGSAVDGASALGARIGTGPATP